MAQESILLLYMKSSKLCLYHTLELGQRKAAKTKLDPQPSFDHHCHNTELSLNYKGESDFSCLQGLSAFLVHDRGSLSKDSAHLSGVARVYVLLGQRQVEKMAQDKPYPMCVCLGFQLLTLWDHPLMPGQSFCPALIQDEFELHWMSEVKKVSIKNTHRLLIFDKGIHGSCGLTPYRIGHKDQVLCFHTDIPFLNKGKAKLCTVKFFPKWTGREKASYFRP